MSARLRVCVLLVLAAAARPLSAQVTQRINTDTLRPRADSTRDTTGRRGKGLSRTPSRVFPAADSIIEELLTRPGFSVLRYMADSVQLLTDDKEVRLYRNGLVAREGSTLEADTIRYQQSRCTLQAAGGPHLFDTSGVLVGFGMQYDACNHTGFVEHAKTDLDFGGGTWYLLGHMAFDNQEDRVYAASATFTSCELIDPHYHFATREVKWVNKRLMVARPAVLYVADVPIAWLPFVFQDTRHGRRSGILAPGFGINDIVRFSPSYQRHISNIGYYWALSDYTDAQVSLDWYSNVYTTINGRFRYRWLDRFLAGGIAFQRMQQADGSSSSRISWSHQQQFSLTSQLTASLDYATSSQIISRNAVDPVLAIGTIDSRLNYSKRFDWGTLALGGSRTQSLDKPQVSATFPTVSFSPNPIAISRDVTWSPSFSFTNTTIQHGSTFPVFTGPGVVDSLRTDSRSSSLNLSTPLRVGRWNFPNSLSITDEWSNTPTTTTDTATHTVRTSAERFQTGLDWSTAIGLPVAFQGSWNVAPSVSMSNTTGGPYAVRNTYTGGRFVSQGKRFQFTLGSSPTLFALLPGIGPVSRIRHAISPSLSWAYAPAADIPVEYARATNQGQLPATLRQPARQAISLGLSQIFEAKLRPPRAASGDSARVRRDSARTGPEATAPEGRKIKLLSIQSDPITYDFEQAKLPGRNGWATQAWGNTVSSDLLHGLSVRFSHDLWDGPVGYDSTRFAPFLTSMTFGFSLTSNTLNLFRSLLGLAPSTPGPAGVAGAAGAARADRPDSSLAPPSPTNPGASFTNSFQQGPLATAFSSVDRMSPAHNGTPFQASLNFSLQRSRPATTTITTTTGSQIVPVAPPTSSSMLSGQVSFSPTPHWTVSWQTSYNFTQGQFSDHIVRLDRDLHDWRATFTFVKSPNGNFMFNFFIVLIAEADLKVGYDQRTVR